MANSASQRPTTAQVYATLKGQTLHFPSLDSILSPFPTELSLHYDRLKEIVDRNIEDRIEEPEIREKAKKINIALMCAYWYPRSSLSRLSTISWFLLWIFLWDDEAEESTTLDLDLNSTTSLSERALKYVAFHLGLNPPPSPSNRNMAPDLPPSPPASHDSDSDSEPEPLSLCLPSSSKEPPPPTKYSTLFTPFASAFRLSCTPTELSRLYSEIELYLHSSALEVSTYADGHGFVPTEEEYWEYRRGTNGIGFFACLGEFMTETSSIPPYLFETKEMKMLWEELARNVVIVNDILSLPKEMKLNWPGLVVIYLTYRTSGFDLNKTITLLVEELGQISDKMEAAGKRLREMVAGDPDPMVREEDVEKYLHSVYTIMTGHYEWTLATERYGLAKRGWLKGDKSVVIYL